MSRHTEEFESRVLVLEDQLAKVLGEVEQLQIENKSLKNKVFDLETCSRRNNLRLVGIPEREENEDGEGFLESVILEMVSGPKCAVPRITVESALVPRETLQTGRAASLCAS